MVGETEHFHTELLPLVTTPLPRTVIHVSMLDSEVSPHFAVKQPDVAWS